MDIPVICLVRPPFPKHLQTPSSVFQYDPWNAGTWEFKKSKMLSSVGHCVKSYNEDPWDWYIYLHLFDILWKMYIGKYTIHGSYGYPRISRDTATRIGLGWKLQDVSYPRRSCKRGWICCTIFWIHPYAPIPSASGFGVGFGYLNTF